MSVASMHKCAHLQSFYDHDQGEGHLGEAGGWGVNDWGDRVRVEAFSWFVGAVCG